MARIRRAIGIVEAAGALHELQVMRPLPRIGGVDDHFVRAVLRRPEGQRFEAAHRRPFEVERLPDRSLRGTDVGHRHAGVIDALKVEHPEGLSLGHAADPAWIAFPGARAALIIWAGDAASRRPAAHMVRLVSGARAPGTA